MDRSAGARSDDEVSYSTVSTAPPKRRAGRTKFRETRHPVYKGVRQRNADKWVCEVREPNKKTRIWLGTFPTAEMAGRAHDVAAIALRGRSACLNFADSAWLLPSPKSSSPRDIQEAAAKVVELFSPALPAAEEAQPEASAATRDAASSSSYREVEDPFYMEEELDFGMQGYWDMAQGLLMEPPFQPAGQVAGEEEQSDDVEVPLWSYSI